MSLCPCQKVRYPTREHAADALLTIRIRRALGTCSARRREQRSYYCTRCAAWHLTARALNTGGTIR